MNKKHYEKNLKIANLKKKRTLEKSQIRKKTNFQGGTKDEMKVPDSAHHHKMNHIAGECGLDEGTGVHPDHPDADYASPWSTPKAGIVKCEMREVIRNKL
jgi:hypothetical protein